MKRLIVVLVSMLVLSSCGDNAEETLIVTGKVKGLKKGMLYLQHVPDSVLVTVDSLAINGDGNFTFKSKLESPEIYYLYLKKKDNNDINDRITFFAEPGTITINTDWNTFDTTAKISGSKSHEKLEEYRMTMSGINKKNIEIMMKASQPENQLSQVSIDSLENISNRNLQRGYAFAINFALNNKNSFVAPYIALKEIPDANVKYLDSIYSVLSPEVANSKYGEELALLLKKK
ncbi:DUF4369 domain-containing protein [Maribacter arcticus]|jgi:hypothetical protein|uniref:DUF4369 domain-containing protein n=1 Tax=Maribacter arcticus TaxID=561365 RepID=A0A1T5C9E9_9FLAO|nr:DUF4369 domain-containing protein [Maribacter arcticus]SKB56078.1 protein of unknown function [Maribacter arcticus]|tara:strand:- start:2276 stop:2971 length:696 start_codon:yes stop_codon:yes gene_type:complete